MGLHVEGDVGRVRRRAMQEYMVVPECEAGGVAPDFVSDATEGKGKGRRYVRKYGSGGRWPSVLPIF